MKTETYSDVRKQEYLITFRGHGALSECQTLTSCDGGLADHARSAAENWCRSRKSPFAVYTVGEITGTVSVDIESPYIVFVNVDGVQSGHHFRRQAEADGFQRRCSDSGLSSVLWLNRNRRKAAGR